MKVLLAGAGGQIGRALLVGAPPTVTVTGFSRAEFDITDPHAVVSRVTDLRPDVIINAAAYTLVDQAEKDADAARRVNSDGPRHLAVAARQIGARMLHISTDFVFDGMVSTPYKPDAPTNPLSVYGATKRAGEEKVLQELPTRSVILRTAWVYSAQGRNFLSTMLRLMRTQGVVRVVADQIGTPTSAASVADTIWKLIQRPDLHGVHHWTDAGVASWFDFAVAIAEEGAAAGLLPADVTVIPITTAEYPTPARRPSFSVLDKSSLISQGIVPVHWRANLRTVLGEVARA